MRFVVENDVTAVAAAPSMFSDGVRRAEILYSLRESGDEPGLRAHRFAYEPGARSAWHTHDGEQALFVVAGQGLVQLWGDSAATAIGPGDWVHIQPGEKHWHGANPDDTLVHFAVTASGGTTWHEAVTDDDYEVAAMRCDPNARRHPPHRMLSHVQGEFDPEQLAEPSPPHQCWKMAGSAWPWASTTACSS